MKNILEDKNYLICTRKESELNHLRYSLSIIIENYIQKLNEFQNVPNAFEHEKFQVALFSEKNPLIIKSVEFSKFFLLDIDENKSLFDYSAFLSENNQNCNTKQNGFQLPNQLSGITSVNCCFQIFNSESTINICILKKICMFKKLIFLKTLNSGCNLSQKGGLEIYKRRNVNKEINYQIPLKPAKKINKIDAISISKQDPIILFCESTDLCGRIQIWDRNHEQEDKEVNQIKIKNDQIIFNSKNMQPFNIKDIEKFQIIEKNNLKLNSKIGNDQNCILMKTRNFEKIICGNSEVTKKFQNKINQRLIDLKKISKPLKVSLPQKIVQKVKQPSLRYNIFYSVSDGRNFINKEIILGLDAVTDSNSKVFLYYNKVKNCDICYITEMNNRCCLKFIYQNHKVSVCLTELQNKVYLCNTFFKINIFRYVHPQNNYYQISKSNVRI